MQAYTYLLTHIPTGKRYYGVKYGQKANPDNLWVTYFSSSKIIKSFIKRDGIHSFKAEVRKLFNTPEDALLWEQTLIRRCKLRENKLWFNEGCGSAKLTYAMKHKTPEHIQKVTESRVSKGYTHSKETRQKIGNHNRTRTDEWKQKISNSLLGRKHSENTKQKRSNSIKSVWSDPEYKEKLRKSHREAWKSRDRMVSEETRTKISETLKRKHKEVI